MKLLTRVLLTLPFVLATLLYYYFNDPDDICHGLADLLRNVLLYAFLLLGLIFAAIAIFKNRQSTNFKFEPISFTFIFLSVAGLFYHFLLRGHTNGDIFLTGENRDIGSSNEKQVLTLRKNRNFTVEFISTDFTCSISDTYDQVVTQLFLIN